jgi:lipopolysaccharide exporter
MLKSSYSSRIFKLVGSSVIAQLITVLSSPLLTRLYSPEDFGLFSLYLSFTGIMGPICAFNLELAIQRQETDDKAFGIFELGVLTSLVNATLFSILFFVLVWFELLGFGVLHWSYAFLVMITLLAISSFGLSRFLLIRLTDFGTINSVTIVRGAIRSGLQCLLGVLATGSIGLVMGETLGRAAGNFRMISRFKDRLDFWNRPESFKERFVSLKNYPLYVAPSTLINATATLIPVILINKYFSVELAGLYGLVIRAVDLPVGVIGSSVADAFFERAHHEKEKLKELIWTHVFWLFLIAIVGAAGVFFTAEMLFEVVFGDAWGGAGKVLVLLLPHFIFQFSIYPVSRTLHLIGRERFKLVYDLMAFISAILPFVFGGHYGWDFETAVLTYSCFRGMSYLSFFFIILKLIDNDGRTTR